MSPYLMQVPVPDAQDILHHLKTTNAHFAALAERYHVVNREIHRIEAEVEPSSDARTEDLKKQRLLLIDEISQRVETAKAA
ncbi:MAG: YdcH family protein [Chakrabartia sp.]